MHLNLSKLRTEYCWSLFFLGHSVQACINLQIGYSLPIYLISCHVFSIFVAANNKSSLGDEIPNRDVTYHFTGNALLIYH